MTIFKRRFLIVVVIAGIAAAVVAVIIAGLVVVVVVVAIMVVLFATGLDLDSGDRHVGLVVVHSGLDSSDVTLGIEDLERRGRFLKHKPVKSGSVLLTLISPRQLC